MLRSDAIHAARHVARQHGYALAVHGSQVKDLDLLAAPWTEDAGDPHELIESIRIALNAIITNPVDNDPKPHGRLAVAMRPTGKRRNGLDHWFVDLSVMPRGDDASSPEEQCR